MSLQTRLVALANAIGADIKTVSNKVRVVKVVSTTDIALSGLGSSSGRIDDVDINSDDRILLIGQNDQTKNGVYTYSVNGLTGGWSFDRAPDFDQGSEIIKGQIIVVTEGTQKAGSQYIVNVDNPTIGTTPITFGAAGDRGSPTTVSQEGWHQVGAAGEPAFLNGWVNYATDGSQVKVGFRKDPAGRVYLSGLVKDGTSGNIFTLPAGYRPTIPGAIGSLRFDVPASSPSTAPRPFIGVDSAGLVQAFNVSGAGTWVDLSGVSFDIGQTTFPASIVTVSQEGWHVVGTTGEPAFQNGYGNSGNVALRFRKDPTGRVIIEGDISSANPADDLVAFTLPVGYRPDAVLLGPLLITNAVAGAYCTIGIDGTVKLHRLASANQVLLRAEFWVAQTTFPAGKSVIPVVNALPEGPTDGYEVYFQSAAMATTGVMWHLRYRAASSSLYKWECVGGGSMIDEIATDESISAAVTAYSDLATVGPQVVLPLAGDYEFTIGARFYPSSASAGFYMFATLNLNADGGNDANGLYIETPGAIVGSGSRTRTMKRTVTSPQTVKLLYKKTYTGANANFANRLITAKPVRVG